MKVLKWVGIVLGSLVGVALAAAVVFGLMGGRSVSANHAGEVHGPTELGIADVDRGRYLVEEVIGCAECHGEGLAGNPGFGDEIPGMTLAAPNITPGGVSMSTDDWVNALRHGVGKDGRRLLIMPAAGFANLTADDLASVIAYLEQIPAAGEPTPAREVSFVGQVFVGLGMIPDEYSASKGVEQQVVSPAPTAEYGAYLDAITCVTCFFDFSGFTEDDFRRLATEGRFPDGTPIDPENPDLQPWAGVTDEDLAAMWSYIETTR